MSRQPKQLLTGSLLGRARGSLAALAVGCILAMVVGGCGDTAEPHQSPADRALADPMGYGPKTGKPTQFGKPADPPAAERDGSFDREGFKKDLNNVFNP